MNELQTRAAQVVEQLKKAEAQQASGGGQVHMTFNELVAEVQIWVNRPDMDAAIRSAVRAVTLKYHRKEKFWRDLESVSLVGLPLDTVQLVDIATYLPGFRQLLSVEGATIVEAHDLYDEAGYARTNIAFLAGTSLNIKHYGPRSSVAVSYYKDPVVAPENLYASWIADTQPDLLIAGAAARSLAWKNESEIFAAATLEERSQWAELLQNNIESVGR